MRVSNETKVGALTVIAVTLMILGFNFLKGKTFFKSGTFIYAKYADTKGLIVSNPVFVNGFQVGTVFEIENMNNNLSELVVCIKLNQLYKIPKNSIATIQENPLGTNAINIIQGTSSSLIVSGDTIQSAPATSLLGDLMNDDHIPSNRLDLIFRQGKGSTIAQLAKSIDKSEKIELISTSDMGVVEKNGNLVKVVKDIQEKSFKAGYNESDVQVLYPKYKGENGIDKLNAILKPKINEEQLIVKYKESEYQVGNKIMQLKNDYDKEIYNAEKLKVGLFNDPSSF